MNRSSLRHRPCSAPARSPRPSRVFGLALLLAGLCLAPAARAQYVLLHGNLHAHTHFSDNQSTAVSTYSPGSAAAEAQSNTLDVFSTTDHAEYLSPDAWESTKTQMAQATKPGSFVALWGFEWTGSKDSSPLNASGLGHLNVYGSAHRCGVSPNPGVPLDPAADWAKLLWWTHSGAADPTAGSLYRWIVDNGASPLGGSIVAQFNHPSGMPGVSFANPTQKVTDGASVVVEDWWRKLEWVEPLDPYFCLIEMGGRTPDPSNFYQPVAHSVPWDEPYFQLALDNGWHVAPTNNEDNHKDKYGQDAAPRPKPDSNNVLVSTGIWAEPTTGLTAAQAEGKVLAALRARRTFSAEYMPNIAHRDGTSLKLLVNTVADGVKWMGDRTLKAEDLSGSRCHLEVKPGKGLTVGSVDIVTNRGLVVKSLPVSGSGVTFSNGTTPPTALWDFGLSAEPPGAQIRASSQTPYATNSFAQTPLPPTWNDANRAVVLNAMASPHIERYYYVRVIQRDTSGKPYYAVGAPVWVQRAEKTASSYRWDFGDGTAAITQTPPPANQDLPFGEITHTYAGTGTVYYPRVTVSYTDGTSDSAITRVVFGAAPASPFYGDVNGDGQINSEDVRLLYRFIAGFQSVASDDARAQFNRANVAPEASGGAPGAGTRLDVADLLRLARFLNGGLGPAPVWP